ncbi:hypothetical protein Nepgr_002689 [Nepenthes gracilis]|uniref:Uncharacterized protein n=1 Tax=Nepenthes gracilis TaxID=150966 RepID=A0AAD3P887_NEPGR|nr:hypothetical protein Nepgr_002689 [Nepenthes gracilis]
MSPSDAIGLMDCKFSGDILLPDGAMGALRIDQAHMLATSVSSGPPNAHLQVQPADGGEGCLVLCFVSWSCAPGYGRTIVVGYWLLEVEEVGGGTAMPFCCWQELLPSYFLKRDASNLSSLEYDYQSGDFGVGS